MSKIIIIRGPLGVGKTTVSKMLAKNIGAKYISVDKIIDDNNLVKKDGIPVKNFIKANEIIFKMIDKNNKTFIIDGNFYYQEQIDDLKNKFPNDVKILTLMTSLKKCLERDSQREKVYGKASTEYVYMITTKIKAGEEIDTTDLNVEETVKKIMEKI